MCIRDSAISVCLAPAADSLQTCSYSASRRARAGVTVILPPDCRWIATVNFDSVRVMWPVSIGTYGAVATLGTGYVADQVVPCLMHRERLSSQWSTSEPV